MRLIPLAGPRCGRQSPVARQLMRLFRHDVAFRRSFGIHWRQIPLTPAQTLRGAEQWSRKQDGLFWVIERAGKVVGTAWAKQSGHIRCDLSRMAEKHRKQVLALIADAAP